MPTTITAAIIKKAIVDAKPGLKRYEITDARVHGLILRVSATGAQWQLKYQLQGKDRRLALGSIDMWTIAEARELANSAHKIKRDKTGVPSNDWLDRMRQKLGKTQPVPVEYRVAKARDLFSWTFADGRDEWLEEIERTRRPKTHADYRSVLILPAFKPYLKRHLPSISRQDMTALVNKVHRSGKESQAEHIVRVLSPFWKWLESDDQIRKSCVTKGVMDGLKAPERTLDEDEDDVGEYVPPLEEVGRIIAIARSGALDPVISGAVELCAWTAQRRRAVAEAKRTQFEDLAGFRGLWHIPPASRKTRKKSGVKKRPHVIPLPPAVWASVQRSLDIADKLGSDYAFPQLRKNKNGDMKTSLKGATITKNFALMPGVQASPHDMRRALGTHGEFKFGLLRTDTDAILDHSSTTSDVSGTHYSLHNGTHRTWTIMETWVNGLQPYIDAAIAELDPVKIKAAIAAERKRLAAERKARMLADAAGDDQQAAE